MNTRLRWLAGAALVLWASLAQAAFHIFRLEQLYSNADGSVQFVVLHESFGGNGENFWTGQSLRATPTGGAASNFVFGTDLPSKSTANKRVLVATPGFAALGIVTPDYVMPANFLPINGGTVSYAAGVHQVTYPSLPTDGVNALSVRYRHPGAQRGDQFRRCVGQRHDYPRTDDRSRHRVLQRVARPLFHYAPASRDRHPRCRHHDQGLGAHAAVVLREHRGGHGDIAGLPLLHPAGQGQLALLWPRHGGMRRNRPEVSVVRQRGSAVLPRQAAGAGRVPRRDDSGLSSLQRTRRRESPLHDRRQRSRSHGVGAALDCRRGRARSRSSCACRPRRQRWHRLPPRARCPRRRRIPPPPATHRDTGAIRKPRVATWRRGL